ncbi:MspA family porin [Nocardia seriolae]|uniref:MspA family porin n=1 Tax=Nocardia seriolae TaxID=37332 RepID=UPI000EF28B95|nr:MspA family porin [Nocardia seriolae]RLP24153.1 porin [Nocardia seriolae]WKY49595.1 MspA family porin [Nocardia seriolae]
MRNNTTALSRTAVVAVAGTIGLALSGGTGIAAVDGDNSIVDQQGRTVEAMSADTRIDFVPPLDGNPLTREWFHSGKACFQVTLPAGDPWTGHITMGYQVGYPATLSGKISFQYQTPGLELEIGKDGPKADIYNLIPTLGIQLDVGFGPGIQSVDVAGGDVSGSDGCIMISGFHGTVTGILGTTTIRPFVRLVSSSGDTVVAYGPLARN